MFWVADHVNQSIINTYMCFILIISIYIKIFVENMEYLKNLENLIPSLFLYGEE